MLSIIIPHYNSIQKLKILLDSIPLQNNIEIIVVDDKSDKDLKLLSLMMRDNKYKHVTFLKNKQNRKGAGVCRNIGLKKASGKWVLFADADDYFLEGFYLLCEKYFNTDNDIVFFTPTSISLDDGRVSDRHIAYKKIINDYYKKGDVNSELFLRYKFFVPWSKLIRVSYLKENDISFDEVIASNDVMFSTKVGYYMNKFEVTNDIIYCVTRNKGSLTVNINENIFDARLKTYINYYKFLKENLNSTIFKALDVRGGIGFLVTIIKFNMGFKKFISTYALLRKSKVQLFTPQYFNPIFIYKRFKYHYKIQKGNKKYYVKD